MNLIDLRATFIKLAAKNKDIVPEDSKWWEVSPTGQNEDGTFYHADIERSYKAFELGFTTTVLNKRKRT